MLAVEGCIWVRILLGFIGLARVMSFTILYTLYTIYGSRI